MRNSPLWRPQPVSSALTGSEPSGKRQLASVLALSGLGLALVCGVSALVVLSFQNGDAVAPLEAAEIQPVPQVAASTTSTAKVERPAPPAATARQVAPTTLPTIDVAIAQNELDVARLEEMTGMVPAAPAPVIDDARLNVVAPPATADALPETDADTSTETASILPDAPAVEASTPPASTVESPSSDLPPLSATKVSRYVNMRSGPADEASTITIVPAGATVQAASNCGWCLVTYEGKRGYIYKSFLSRPGAATAAKEGAPAVNSKKPGLY